MRSLSMYTATSSSVPTSRQSESEREDQGSTHPLRTKEQVSGPTASSEAVSSPIQLNAMTSDLPDGRDVLYQDARWPGTARLIYGVLIAPFWVFLVAELLGARHRGTSEGAIALVLAFLSLLAAVCEWRARKMGILITEDDLILIRALNRTRIPWSEIEDFSPVPYGLWGEARLRVKRRGRLRSKIAVPTLILTPSRSWWTWWFQPARLRCVSGEVDDPTAFLRGRLHSVGSPL
jgi:hypothetical protein